MLLRLSTESFHPHPLLSVREILSYKFAVYVSKVTLICLQDIKSFGGDGLHRGFRVEKSAK